MSVTDQGNPSGNESVLPEFNVAYRPDYPVRNQFVVTGRNSFACPSGSMGRNKQPRQMAEIQDALNPLLISVLLNSSATEKAR
jgi:hypothetical protein